MHHSVLVRAILFSLLLSTFFSNVNAVPLVLSHQGRLLDAGDAPISGTFTIVYSIYDAPVGGTQLWMEDHVGVVVTDGLFSVELGSVVPLTADIVAGSGGGGGGGGGAIRFLQVQIAGQPPIMPRTALVSSPYSVASSRVSGDIQTAPGELKLSAASDTKRIGIRVADSLAEASSIAIDEPGVQIALRITPDSTVFDQGQSSGSRVMVHKIHMGENRISQVVTPTTSGVAINTKGTGAEKSRVVMQTTLGGLTPGASAVLDADSDGDGIPEGEISQSVTPTTSNVAIKTKGTGADPNRVLLIENKATPGELSSVSSIDNDGDTVPESEISQSVTPTTCGVAIKTKGTGADPNRVLLIENRATPGELSSVSSIDNDGNTVPESEISQSVTPTTCGVAIKTKGTGADANRSALVSSTTEVGEISTVSTLDEDGDGLSESSISQRIAPTTSSLAIKTKGTSAQRTQTISGDCDDESSVLSLDTDDDGDGIADAKVVLGSGASLLGGALPGGAVISARYDNDDDGIAEQGIDQIVTPTTSSVAIKTKGTGADPNRVIGGTDDTTATMLMATDSASISMKVRKGGVIKGSIIINNGSALRMVEMGSDGNSYFASGVGIGVDATHKIDVAGGAYCDGTNWVNASDRNSKENFESVNGEEILEKISELEITKWNYKGDDDAQHIGPTAQDFKKTFGVGADDKSISTIDPSGIALAAIKELYAQLQAKDKEMKELREEMAKLKKEMAKKN